MKNTVIALLLLLATGLAAQSGGESPDRTLAPYFHITTPGFHTDPLPLKATSADVNIAGVIADVLITQVYVNNGKTPLEAVYVFPGSTNAAVYAMQMQIGRRLITARIAEKQKARAEYEAAKAEGKRASLLEQHRPNVFQMNVANIMPGDTIAVRLRYTELLVPREGVYQFVYPTVVGPHYNGDPGSSTAASNYFVQYPFLHEGKAPTYTFDLHIHLSGGMPLQDVSSSTHAVQVSQQHLNEADIRLDPAERAGGNRDFILNYSLKGKKIESGLLLYENGAEKFFLYMAQPPKQVQRDAIPPREYIFIVDVSGSMNGFPLDVSKTLLRNLVGSLAPKDRFNVILFAGVSNILSEQSLPGTPENLEKAIQLIDQQTGGGGTNLLPALERAFSLPRNTEGLSRSFVLATDGYVSVEKEAYDLVRRRLNEANLFAFGIGSGVNRYLIEGLARAGQSEPAVITKPEEAAAAAERFHQYIATPVLTQINAYFKGFDAYDMEPLSIPDILAERPVILFGKYRGNAGGKIGIRGRAGSKKYDVAADVAATAPDSRNAALRYLWARERIKMLDDFGFDSAQVAEVTRLGLEYTLLTAYTSFVAVDEEIAHDGSVKPATVKQPVPLPAGVSDLAVGFDLSVRGLTRCLKNAVSPAFSTSNRDSDDENAAIPYSALLLVGLLVLGFGLLLWFRLHLARA